MTSYLFQPKRGGVKSRLWSARVRLDGWPRRRTFPLHVSDRRVAQEKMRALIANAEREAAGIVAPQAVRDGAHRTLAEHLQTFLGDLESRGRSKTTLRHYRNVLTKLFARCRWVRFADVTPASFCAWRAKSKLSPKFQNDQLGVMLTMLNWMEKRGHVITNPLKPVERVANHAVGTYRRAIPRDGIHRLLAVAPPKRAAVYLLILYTGLRRKELNALTWGDFDLKGATPRVIIPASLTKNRKPATLPLRPELVAALGNVQPANVQPADLMFGRKLRVPSPAKLREDLAAARIPFKDERGRRIDVHALRHTFGTELSAAGASPRIVMELMRHSDIRLTMRVYTDAAQLPLAADLALMPSYNIGKHDAPPDAPPDALSGVFRGRELTSPVITGQLTSNR
jgi:integrase